MPQPPRWESLAATTGRASPERCTASAPCAAAAARWWASPAAWGGPCPATLSWSATSWKVRQVAGINAGNSAGQTLRRCTHNHSRCLHAAMAGVASS